jgi:hypothetical protein
MKATLVAFRKKKVCVIGFFFEESTGGDRPPELSFH